MGSQRAHEFWTGDTKYHDLAQEFERNITIVHPDSITSDGKCPVGHILHYCTACRTSVIYYEHRA